MLLKEEFAANMSYLEPSINSMILAGEDLMTNKSLQEVLYMVLVAGNFLNSVSFSNVKCIMYLLKCVYLIGVMKYTNCTCCSGWLCGKRCRC